MPESYILFEIPGSEEPIERGFLESIECDPGRDVFETMRPNDQHAGW